MRLFKLFSSIECNKNKKTTQHWSQASTRRLKVVSTVGSRRAEDREEERARRSQQRKKRGLLACQSMREEKKQDWTTVEVMHITVSFKDHSSICTCMLLILKKKRKKKSWMIEQKQGHHHKQTNSQPMRGEEVAVNNRGGGQTDSFHWRNWCVQQQQVSSARRQTWPHLEGCCTATRGRVSPQNQLNYSRCVIRKSARSRSRSQISSCWGLFVLAPIRPANPGHFKVPYQLLKVEKTRLEL